MHCFARPCHNPVGWLIKTLTGPFQPPRLGRLVSKFLAAGLVNCEFRRASGWCCYYNCCCPGKPRLAITRFTGSWGWWCTAQDTGYRIQETGGGLGEGERGRLAAGLRWLRVCLHRFGYYLLTLSNINYDTIYAPEGPCSSGSDWIGLGLIALIWRVYLGCRCKVGIRIKNTFSVCGIDWRNVSTLLRGCTPMRCSKYLFFLLFPSDSLSVENTGYSSILIRLWRLKGL